MPEGRWEAGVCWHTIQFSNGRIPCGEYRNANTADNRGCSSFAIHAHITHHYTQGQMRSVTKFVGSLSKTYLIDIQARQETVSSECESDSMSHSTCCPVFFQRGKRLTLFWSILSVEQMIAISEKALKHRCFPLSKVPPMRLLNWTWQRATVALVVKILSPCSPELNRSLTTINKLKCNHVPSSR